MNTVYNQPFLSAAHGNLPDFLAEHFEDFQDAYRTIHSAMCQLMQSYFVSEKSQPVAVGVYVVESGNFALVARKNGVPLSIKVLDVEDVPDVEELKAHIEAFMSQVAPEAEYDALDMDLGVPLFSAQDELNIWAHVRQQVQASAIPESLSVDEACDDLMSTLGQIIRENNSDDDLADTLALAAAFAAARDHDTLEADALEMLSVTDDYVLLAWAYLLVRAGRGTGTGAAMALGDMNAALRSGGASLEVSESLLLRIPSEELLGLQNILNSTLVLSAEHSEEILSCRAQLSVLVEASLTSMVPELFAWLASKEGLTAWLRPDFKLLTCYPEGLDDDEVTID